METLVWLLIFLVIIGIVFWLLQAYVLPAIPIPEPFKMAILAILSLIVILWLVSQFIGAPPAFHVR